MRELRLGSKFAVVVSMVLFIGCATLPKLDVTYKMLPRSGVMEGKEIYFKVTDKRPARDIIGPGAKRVYEDFAGNITLIVETGARRKSTVGLYDVRELFERAFTYYLENRGLKLSSEPKEEIPRLEIAIHDFTLDLRDMRWTAKIVYEAAVSLDGSTLIRRHEGEGEKLRISGLTQAHQVMSETFSETIHQLDVMEMFSALPAR